MEPALEPYVGKKYRLKSSENFDEYLKYIGVGLVSRKLACSVSPVSVLARDGDVYTFTMATTFRTVTFSFKLNQEFVEERPDGCKLTSLVTFSDGSLVHSQVEPGASGRRSAHVRTFTPDTLTVLTSLVTFSDGSLVHSQVEPGASGRRSAHVRTFTPDTLTVETTADGWEGKCIRIYEAIP